MRDPIAQLTIAELDSGSRLLKADLVGAISNSTMERWQALAIVAYLTARRSDPAVQLATFRAMTAAELTAELGLDEPGVDVAQVAADAGVDVEVAAAVLTAAGVDVEQAPATDATAAATTTDAPVDTTDAGVDTAASDPTEPAPAS